VKSVSKRQQHQRQRKSESRASWRIEAKLMASAIAENGGISESGWRKSLAYQRRK
jgi:hypothetical protein